jgi:hypothetical protein
MSGTTITSVDLPANSQYLKEVHYPSTITDIRLDNIASLKTVKFDGVTNLQNVYINQKDISSVDTYSLIKMIAAQSANIESIELYNVNWSNCSVDILNYLLKMGAKVTGKINVADESTDKKYFSYSLKKTMVDTFGEYRQREQCPLRHVYEEIHHHIGNETYQRFVCDRKTYADAGSLSAFGQTIYL